MWKWWLMVWNKHRQWDNTEQSRRLTAAVVTQAAPNCWQYNGMHSWPVHLCSPRLNFMRQQQCALLPTCLRWCLFGCCLAVYKATTIQRPAKPWWFTRVQTQVWITSHVGHITYWDTLHHTHIGHQNIPLQTSTHGMTTQEVCTWAGFWQEMVINIWSFPLAMNIISNSWHWKKFDS